MLEKGSHKWPKLNYIHILALSVSIVMLFAAIAYAAFWPRFNDTEEELAASEYILTPNLVGHDLAEVEKIVKDDGLSLKIDRWVTSKIHMTNSVISQNPQPNNSIRVGETITVTISSGSVKSNGSAKEQKKVNIVDNLKPLPIPAVRPVNAESIKTIVIDPGHQRKANLSKEPNAPGSSKMKAKTLGGTSGKKTCTPEYKVTLQIAERLKAVLEENNIKVVMTRESHDVDISNIERAKIANKANADLMIRIHADGSTDSKKNGISTLYPADNKWTAAIHKESYKAAKLIQDSVVKATGHKDNGLVARDDITGFNWCKVPVMLIETGFLTNPQEEADLLNDSYQDKLAKAMAEGIIEYLNGI